MNDSLTPPSTSVFLRQGCSIATSADLSASTANTISETGTSPGFRYPKNDRNKRVPQCAALVIGLARVNLRLDLPVTGHFTRSIVQLNALTSPIILTLKQFPLCQNTYGTPI